MASLTGAIRSALIASPALAGFLSQYQNAPAVFSEPPIPEDAKEPYIMISSRVSATPGGDMSDPWGIYDERRDLTLVAKVDGTVKALDEAAEAMRAALDFELLAVDGYRRARSSIVEPPRELSADTDEYGRVMSISVHLTK